MPEVSTDSDTADCLFCRIIAGEIPGDFVHQDQRLVAFRDIAPKAPFHVLVAPREHQPHAAASAAADPTIVGELVTAADVVARAEGYDDYRLIFNTGADAGQTVFHTHLHVLAGKLMGEGFA
ncbi:MAG TPA: HIT domain-containing protein [Nocardioides sp.]|uniref:HIT domain-containing protein n=1 Tax=Nocardioides sp. TaxID=35761 RepID=UPI002ED97EEA